MTRLLSFCILLFTVALSACAAPAGSADGDAATEQLQVVTTIAQIGDAAAAIGGEHVAVVSLMGAGVDPHLYAASAGDVDLLQNADVIFYNGLFLEAQMAEVLEKLGETKTTVAIGEQLDKSRLLASADYADENDPHIWFDVPLWRDAVSAIRDTLVTADPDNAAAYEANATAYLDELDALHAYVAAAAATVPADKRVLITAHDAFNYFGNAYGFEVLGLQGISTESEAGAGDIQALATLIAEREIPAIFIESSVPRRSVEALQAAVRDKGFDVAIGGELFSDAMGTPGTPEGTYVGMVRHNIDTIVGALSR